MHPRAVRVADDVEAAHAAGSTTLARSIPWCSISQSRPLQSWKSVSPGRREEGPTSDTRTLPCMAIIGAQHLEDPPPRFWIDVCVHSDASPVAKVDLDQSNARDSRSFTGRPALVWRQSITPLVLSEACTGLASHNCLAIKRGDLQIRHQARPLPC